MTDLTFTEENHEYRWRGKVVPSVTTVLQPLTRLWTNGADLERARQEGQAIHFVVEHECKGDLDEEGLPEWLRPYLSAWRKFVADQGFELEFSEHQAYSETWGFAGTLDLAGVLTKAKWRPSVVIDIKRTLGAKTAPLQTAAYAHLLPGPVRRRFGLSLNPARFPEYDNPQDWNDFLVCLAWHKLNQRWNPSSTGTYYRMQKDGHNMLCTADGKRSIFDDVDE